MKIQKPWFRMGFVCLTSAALLSACGTTVKREEIPAGSDPRAELEKTQERLQADRVKQYDQLSPKHFEEAEDSVASAKKRLEKGDKAEKALEDLGTARAHLAEVEKNAARGEEVLGPVLKARQAAMDAMADDVMKTDFRNADNDLSTMGRQIEKGNSNFKARQISPLEAQYSAMELESIKRKQLGESKSLIEKSEKNGAKRRTPQTYEAAQTQFASAARAIEANRRNPEAFGPAVQDSLTAAQKLDRVIGIANKSDVNEQVALQMDGQQQALAQTQASLQKSQSAETEAQQALAQQQASMNRLAVQNKQYQNQEEMQAKIKEAQSQFDPAEAEVLQSGNQMIVRLKKMNFASSQSALSPDSFATLEKVKNLIATVPVERVKVEGHTDATGSAQVNKKVSQSRAEAVKQYLVSQKVLPDDQVEAEGYGYSKPLTDNKTKEHRAMNRRVDIVIDSTETL